MGTWTTHTLLLGRQVITPLLAKAWDFASLPTQLQFKALDEKGLKRIAFVDWDVHHGNGTQSAFYDDPGR